MSWISKYSATLTTTTGAPTTITGYTGEPVRGFVNEISYHVNATSPFSSTALCTITTENSSQTIYSAAIGAASFKKRPRQTVHTTAGSTATYGSTAPFNALEPIGVSYERIKIVMANTTAAAQTGVFDIFIH